MRRSLNGSLTFDMLYLGLLLNISSGLWFLSSKCGVVDGDMFLWCLILCMSIVVTVDSLLIRYNFDLLLAYDLVSWVCLFFVVFGSNMCMNIAGILL